MSLWLSLREALIRAFRPALDGLHMPAIRPGHTRRDEVLRRLGPPDASHRLPDGERLEYSRQPMGITCYMIDLGADGIVAACTQVLSAATCADIMAGMSREAVRRTLGRPASQTRFERRDEEVWRWRVAGDTHAAHAAFDVHFSLTTGTVTGTDMRSEYLP